MRDGAEARSGILTPGRPTVDDGPSAPQPARRAGRRILKWTAGVTSLLLLGATGAAWTYYEHLNGNLRKADLNLGDRPPLSKPAPNAAGQTPLNILLIGSDSRNNAADLALGGSRQNAGRPPLADVEILVHVSADRSNMTVLSVPRDTRVAIPACTDPATGKRYPQTEDIINASLQHGGPGCTVATWEELTGIPIDHFMMVDFAGVVSMADAVGGVPVCVRSNVHDPYSGLRLTAGTHIVRGQQALQWLRTRHGFEDGSDLGRTHAQHMYLSAMIRQLKTGTKLTDPGELMSLANTATTALTVDKGLGSVAKLYGLAEDIRRVPTDRITMTTMPWRPDPLDSTAHVVPTSDARKLFAMVRSDTPVDGRAATPVPSGSSAPSPGPSPSGTPAPKDRTAVTVQNGTGSTSQAPVAGRASSIAQRLQALGFTRATAAATIRSQTDTVISYLSNDLRSAAESVARALGIPLDAVRKSSAAPGIVLIVGSDWRGGTRYPASAAPAATRLPDTAAALNAGDTTACMQVNVTGGYGW